MASANHVLVSLSSENVKFLSIESKPFLSKHFTVDNAKNITGNAFFEIEVIPPQTEIIGIIKINTTKTNSDQPLVINVRSNESTAYSKAQLDTIIISYSIFAILSSLLFLYIWRKYDPFKLRREVKRRKYDKREYPTVQTTDDNYLLFRDFVRGISLRYPSDWIIDKPNLEFFHKAIDTLTFLYPASTSPFGSQNPLVLDSLICLNDTAAYGLTVQSCY